MLITEHIFENIRWFTYTLLIIFGHLLWKIDTDPDFVLNHIYYDMGIVTAPDYKWCQILGGPI